MFFRLINGKINIMMNIKLNSVYFILLFSIFSVSLAMKQDANYLKDLKDNLFQVNETHELHLAVLYKNLDLVHKLINQNNINQQTESGFTSICIAAYIGDINITKELIKNGADINLATSLGWTGLILACELFNKSGTGNQYLNVIKELIRAGAVINAANVFGDTALHWAVTNNNFSVVKELVLAGANINQINSYGASPLATVMQNDNLKTHLSIIKHFIAVDRGYKNIIIKNDNIVGYACHVELLRSTLIFAIDTLDLKLFEDILFILPDIIITRINDNNDTLLHELTRRFSASRNNKDVSQKTLSFIILLLHKEPRLALFTNSFNTSTLSLAVSLAPEILYLILETAYKIQEKKLL